jgi:hypothetical protein
MLETNANFDTKHALAAKTPLYLVRFDIAQGSVFTDDCSGTITDKWDVSHKASNPVSYSAGAMLLTVVGSASATYGKNAHTIDNWVKSGIYEFAFDYKQSNNWYNDNLDHSEAALEIVPADPTDCNWSTCYRQMEENGFGQDSKLMLRLRSGASNKINVAERISGAVTALYEEDFTYTNGAFDSLKFIVNFTDLWFEVWDMSGTPSIIGARTSFSAGLLTAIGGTNFCVNVHWHNYATARDVSFDNFAFAHTQVDYCNHKPAAPTYALSQNLISISGLSQKVVPEEGRSSIGGVKATILDYNNAITALLSSDDYYFHRKKTIIMAGYAGMAEADLLTVLTGWVTDIKLSSDGLAYEFSITDPQKWMQRKIFRGAEDATVTISGNPINILLAILTSTGAGTNGDYDLYAAANALGIDDDYINITSIEEVRDKWYAGDSHYMSFTINKREKAKDWLEREIFKPLNLYPVVDGDGKVNIKPFKPPFPSTDVQSFTEDNIIGLPRWSANLEGVINEVEFHYDWDAVDEEFDSQDFYIDSTSLNNRGPGKKPIEIKTKGLHSADPTTADVLERRKNKIFNRYATPPVKLSLKTFFNRWLSEAGDIVPVTHRLLPDLENGTRGYSARRMEIINRTVDWKQGLVNFELLDTGFDQGDYMLISPTMTIIDDDDNGTTVFFVSAADAAKYQEGWVVDVFDDKMHAIATNLTITDITDNQITVGSSLGSTAQAGWIVTFSSYANVTAAQKSYWFINEVGVSSYEYLIVP